MISLANTINLFDQIIQLLDKVIWPITVVIILILFRRNLSGVIQRMSSFKADSSGVTMTFQNKIEAAKKLLKNINTTSKSSKGINISAEQIQNGSYDQLLEIAANLEAKLKQLASSNNISTSGNNSGMICEKLKEVGVLSYKNAKLINSIIDLTNLADTSISQKQVDEIKTLFKGVIF